MHIRGSFFPGKTAPPSIPAEVWAGFNVLVVINHKLIHTGSCRGLLCHITSWNLVSRATACLSRGMEGGGSEAREETCFKKTAAAARPTALCGRQTHATKRGNRCGHVLLIMR